MAVARERLTGKKSTADGQLHPLHDDEHHSESAALLNGHPPSDTDIEGGPVPVDVDEDDDSESSGLLNTLNDIGAQVRSSPAKVPRRAEPPACPQWLRRSGLVSPGVGTVFTLAGMHISHLATPEAAHWVVPTASSQLLTALVNFTMMVDGIEATREGTSPWYYLAIDALSFVAGILSTSGYVQEITRKDEYEKTKAKEAARKALKEARRKAEKRLKSSIRPKLLKIDCEEVEDAIHEGEQFEVAPQLLERARAVEKEALEAQRLHREMMDGTYQRRLDAQNRLHELTEPPPLDIDIAALTQAIAKASEMDPNLDPKPLAGDIQMAELKKGHAIDEQRIRANAEARLMGAEGRAAQNITGPKGRRKSNVSHSLFSELLQVDEVSLQAAMVEARKAHVDEKKIKCAPLRATSLLPTRIATAAATAAGTSPESPLLDPPPPPPPQRAQVRRAGDQADPQGKGAPG